MTKLERQLGLGEALALGIGGTIGGGIFVLIGLAAGVAGPGVLLSFILAFVASLTIALPYAELSGRFPHAGGGYAFSHAVFGSNWGFLIGWIYWGGYIFIGSYVMLGFGGYLRALTGIPQVFGAVGLVSLCTILNLAGVKVSGRSQIVIITVAIFSLVLFSLIGLPRVSSSNLFPFLPTGLSGVFSASLLCFLAFGGFDIIAAAGEEVKNPQRNLPLAIVLTLCIALGLYLGVTYVALGLVPSSQLGASGAAIALAATNSSLPSIAPTLVALAAIMTTAATGNAMLVVTSRVMFAMSREGVLPRALSRVKGTTHAPWTSIISCGLLLGIVTTIGTVRLVTSIGGFLYVLHFMFALAALAMLRRKERGSKEVGCQEEPEGFRIPFPGFLLSIAFVLSSVLAVVSGVIGVVFGMSWLAAGVIVFTAWKKFSRAND